MIEYSLVYLRWIDSAGYSTQGWHQIDTHEEGYMTIHSTGFIIKEDDEKITLALNISESGAMMGDITIPKVCIQERRKIKLGKPKEQ